MNPLVRRLIAGSLLVIAIAACGAASPVPSTPPATPEAFAIRAAAAAPQACMDALMGGKLARNAASGLGVTSAYGQATAVEWPFRYSAWVMDGRVVLHDEAGKTIAREGDEITVGGGLGNQLWYACAPVTVTKAAT